MDRSPTSTRSTRAEAAARVDAAAGQTAPLEPDDFYIEKGLVVFTASYHLKRGSCCGSGCRHCPYGHADVPPAQLPTDPEDGAD